LQILRNKLAVPTMVKTNQDPFQTLIITIISQNTSDTNTGRAFENLSNNFEITPQALATAQTSKIEECLHVGGLYKNKAKTIQTVSKIVLEQLHGSLKSVITLPVEEGRKALMQLPGVGPKTADVVLLFSAGQQTVPIDTHVYRVSKRLGLAPQDSSYEDVRINLQSVFEPKDFLAVHLLLIALGRKYCKAQKPNCTTCVVKTFCPSNLTGETHD